MCAMGGARACDGDLLDCLTLSWCQQLEWRDGWDGRVGVSAGGWMDRKWDGRWEEPGRGERREGRELCVSKFVMTGG